MILLAYLLAAFAAGVAAALIVFVDAHAVMRFGHDCDTCWRLKHVVR
jgi:hypothetical protein